MEIVSATQSEPSRRSLADQEREYLAGLDSTIPPASFTKYVRGLSRSRKSAASRALLSASETKFLGACISLSGSVRLQTEGFKVGDEIYSEDFKTKPIVKLPTRLEISAALQIADEIFRRAQLNPGETLGPVKETE